MSNISKPPPILVNEDLVEKPGAKRPVSRLMQLQEAPDPNDKKARGKKVKLARQKPLTRAERRKLQQEQEDEVQLFVPSEVEVSTEPVSAAAPVTEERVFEESTHEAVVNESENVEFEQAVPTTAQTRLAAADPNLDPKHLYEFSKSDIMAVRVIVASNPSINSKTIAKLKKDPEDSVVVALIGNPSFPAKLLPSLLSRAKKSGEVLEALVDREDLPPRLVKQLSKLIPE